MVIILIFVGFRKLPEIGKNVGTALREFQTEANAGLPEEEPADQEGDEEETDPDAPAKAAKPAPGKSIEAEIVGRVLQEVPIIKRVAKIKSKLVK